jgi:transcriptional regulator with XRE-family HTH domain
MADTLLGNLAITPESLRQYQAEEITLRQLADLHGVSVSTVWRELKRRGICRGSRRGRPVNSQTREAVLLLAAKGWSRQQISKQLKVTPEWVRSILAEKGISVSFQILKCSQCGATIATGHKAHQPKANRNVVCARCLGQQPWLAFSERLKSLRLAQNLSVAQLSSKCGPSRAAIGTYERGQVQPTAENARKLASGLGVSLRVLLGPGQG